MSASTSPDPGRGAGLPEATPGPWRVEHQHREWAMPIATVYGTPKQPEHEFASHVEIAANVGDDLGPWRPQTPEERLANAHLIAAAPDLLAALQGMVALCEASLSQDSDVVQSALAAARQAIATAVPSAIPDSMEDSDAA